MGDEIAKSQFETADFERFHRHLTSETKLLSNWFKQGRFESTLAKGGFELEAWLVDERAEPASLNDPFLERLNNPLVVPELAKFNVEINSHPQVLEGNALSRMEAELNQTWASCRQTAQELDARLIMVGILPTVGLRHLCLENMSPLMRYRALDQQLVRLRNGRPLNISIQGRDALTFQHDDVMLESAATSFQIHLKVNAAESARYYNVAKIISAPMVALSANSAFLFGRSLWHETRIPLFEQAIAVGESDLTKRVSFGVGYADESVMECFAANLARYPIILPSILDEPVERLAHLRLHNGTIWRWNRPLIGFSAEGEPHIRIEHRVVPAGPTIVDSIANAAVFFGLSRALVDTNMNVEKRLSFEQARLNFYAAAKDGLDADVVWLDHEKINMPTLLIEHLLPLARAGLDSLGIDPADSSRWLGVIEARVKGGQNGAVWQLRYAAKHGQDPVALTEAYIEHQNTGRPVHEWSI